MQAIQTAFDIRAIQSAWTALDSLVQLRPIHDEAGYDQLVILMNSLLDSVGEDENHALSGLLGLVGDIVSRYEREHYAAYSTPWRTRFHADGGQRSSVIADTVPR